MSYDEDDHMTREQAWAALRPTGDFEDHIYGSREQHDRDVFGDEPPHVRDAVRADEGGRR